MADVEQKSQRSFAKAPVGATPADAATAPAEATAIEPTPAVATPVEPIGADAPAAEPTPEEMEHMALAEASVRFAFGPAFFMTQLRGFAGEKCPDPALERPAVEIHLGDGETLDLCYIIGVTPGWVALAVLDEDEADGSRRMRTEFVPFEAIERVTLRGSRPESPRLGFEHGHVPKVLGDPPRREMTPEAAIRAAAAGANSGPSGD
jgi:hypothetical protein